jgi:release factor glutamine methyltransferase
VQREPVAYITGLKEFWSLDFAVDRAVLIPRPETELLVELAIEFVKPNARTAPLKILGFGTGSGAIAVSMAKELPLRAAVGRRFSVDALRLAQRNAARHGVSPQITFFAGRSLSRPLPMALWSSISSLPIRRTFELKRPKSWRRRFALTSQVMALNGGIDGLDYYRRISKRGKSVFARWWFDSS